MGAAGRGRREKQSDIMSVYDDRNIREKIGRREGGERVGGGVLRFEADDDVRGGGTRAARGDVRNSGDEKQEKCVARKICLLCF
jgi:hypothetical protein